MKKSLLFLISICCLCLLNGCGTSGPPPPPPATHFSVTAPATATAGTAFNITVTALDASNSMVSSYSGTVQLTSSDGQAVQPPSATLTNGTATVQVTLKTVGSPSITATAASLTGASSRITVSANVATQFSVTPTTTTPTAGTSFTVTVTALDASNNVVTSYSGTVHLSSSDAQFVPPANSGLTNGTGTFSATLKTAGGQTITATDTVTPSITGFSSISVSAGPATHFSVTGPTAATSGLQFNFTVTALDTYSNVTTSYTGMVHFSTNDADGTVVPPANSLLTNGTGTFSITLKTIQSTTITATDTTTTSITGNSTITVVSNAATHLALATPGSATTRATFNVTVSALDAANNVSAGYSGTVRFTSTDTLAVFLTNPATLTKGVGGSRATFETAGSWTITATDTVTPSLTITSNSIPVTAAAALAISSNTPPNGTFGTIYGPVTTVNYRCTRYGVCTPCVPSSSCASLPPCYYRNRVFPCRSTRQLRLGFPLAATGGVPPYKWNASGLPPGLGLSETSGDAYISGTPTSPATYTVNVTVTDSGTPQVVSPPSTYTIVINNPPPPVINATPAPPFGAVNLPYSFTFTASSLATPLTWRVSAGALPAGLTLNPDGVLTGTPTAAGTSPITLIAEDSFKQDSAPQAFTIQIFAHGFKATGSMGAARTAATATLLNTGKVLVAGGTDASGKPLATAELYDPATGSFSATGSMATARAHFAAALLCDLSAPPCNDTRVLVTGGLDTNGNPLMSAELYDPSTGTFSATKGGMQFVHASHTATLINTGKGLKVLVVGWGNGVAELFDPATGTFAPTGSMVDSRVEHTATLLKNGKVLVTGGVGAAVLTEAELYDPTTGSFSQTLGSLAIGRRDHTANLLADGTVLVTGGLDTTGKAIATAELFDPTPTTQSFTATKGSLATARFYQTATVLKDGTVLVTGGDDGTGALATAEVYDPTAKTFSPTGSMGTAREWHTATPLNDGTVLVTGGQNGTGVLATAELYQ